MTLIGIGIKAVLLVSVIFILIFLALTLVIGDRKEAFKITGVIFLIMTVIFIVTILTEDGILGMLSAIGLLIIFLTLYLLYHYISKISLKSLWKTLPLSDDAEIEYRKICNRYEESLKIKRNRIYISLIAIIFVWVRMIPILIENDLIEDYMIYIQVVTLSILIMLVKSYQKYSNMYKQCVLPDFINTFIGNTNYYPQIMDTELEELKDAYYISEIDVIKDIDIYAHDGIKYSLNNINIYGATIKVFDQKKEINSFVGIFAYAEFPEKIYDYIKISENKIKKRKSKKEKSDLNFEDVYSISSQNQIYAKGIFTSDVMNVLNDFYQKYELKFEIVLSAEKIYFKFYTGDIFKSKLLGRTINKRNLFMYYAIIEFMRDFIVNLNKALEDIRI